MKCTNAEQRATAILQPRLPFLPRLVLLLLLAHAGFAAAQPAGTSPPSAIDELLNKPLRLADVLNLAENFNANVLKAKKDLEAQHGIAIQTRAIVLPRLQSSGQFRAIESGRVQSFQSFGSNTFRFAPQDESWDVGVQLVQSIYEGGRIQSSLRTARLLQEQAVLDYQTVVADTLLNVRVAYDDALLATNEIVVREASVALLAKELEDTRHRFEAGVVPQFNVLRAEVELANARPRLIRARNNYRIAKQRLVNELGINLPKSVMEDVPLQLADKLAAEPYSINLSAALAQALEKRTELASLHRSEELRKEGVRTAKAGYKPSVQLFAGYGAESRQFGRDLSDENHGWEAGARMKWDIFDGALTRGRVMEARARHERTLVDLDDVGRRIELEVRTTYSSFIEAKEVLDSQEKVNEQAVEALRLANARYDAGTGTQLDVLSAQTALTDARTTYVQALHDYSVARARLERAIGQSIKIEKKP
jgi:outer membrane protein TolC